jgi:ureidoacrylate peracid hydrolase
VGLLAGTLGFRARGAEQKTLRFRRPSLLILMLEKTDYFFRPIFGFRTHCPAPHCDEGKLCAKDFQYLPAIALTWMPEQQSGSEGIETFRTRIRRATQRKQTRSDRTMNVDEMGPDISRSALLIVDMQNDFLHPDGSMGRRAREHPEAGIDLPFLAATIPGVKRLADAFRTADRPVIYIAHVLKPDYSDAQFPYWRLGITKGGNRTLCVEGTWGAEIVDELKPRDGEHLVVKKGFGGFSNTPLDTILRTLDATTCVVTGVTTCVCVSTTIRGGVEHNYRMVLVSDAVAEVSRDAHHAELQTMSRVFADVKTVDEVIEMLPHAE